MVCAFKTMRPFCSSYDIGSLASVKKIPWEYLSRGCGSLSNLRGMTGLVQSDVEVGWFEAETFGCAKSDVVKSVLEVLATHEVDVVLCVGPSWRVGTSEKITLRTSIGFSAYWCMADSLNIMSELQMICLCSGSQSRYPISPSGPQPRKTHFLDCGASFLWSSFGLRAYTSHPKNLSLS